MWPGRALIYPWNWSWVKLNFDFTLRSHYSDQYVYYIPSIGYRFQPLDKNFSFRIFFSPLINSATEYNFSTGQGEKESKIKPWGGLSFGFRL
jgi:hypothetical protein